MPTLIEQFRSMARAGTPEALLTALIHPQIDATLDGIHPNTRAVILQTCQRAEPRLLGACSTFFEKNAQEIRQRRLADLAPTMVALQLNHTAYELVAGNTGGFERALSQALQDAFQAKQTNAGFMAAAFGWALQWYRVRRFPIRNGEDLKRVSLDAFATVGAYTKLVPLDRGSSIEEVLLRGPDPWLLEENEKRAAMKGVGQFAVRAFSAFDVVADAAERGRAGFGSGFVRHPVVSAALADWARDIDDEFRESAGLLLDFTRVVGP